MAREGEGECEMEGDEGREGEGGEGEGGEWEAGQAGEEGRGEGDPALVEAVGASGGDGLGGRLGFDDDSLEPIFADIYKKLRQNRRTP